LIAFEPVCALAFPRLDLFGRRLAVVLAFLERDPHVLQCDLARSFWKFGDRFATTEEA
jgi:hypothetical protein